MDIVAAEDEWHISLKANGTFINFKSDTGVQPNRVPETVILALKKKPQAAEDKWIKLRAYSSDLILTEGVCELKCLSNNNLDTK